MVMRWFQTWLRQRAGVAGGSKAKSSVVPNNRFKLVDLAHEVLRKETIKTKVSRFLSLPLSEEENEEMTEEITEKIADACEQDPRLREFFDDSKPGKY